MLALARSYNHLFRVQKGNVGLALLGIYPEHDERYQTGYTGSQQHPLYRNSIISTHYLSADGMRRVHREWLASQVLSELWRG
jgi:hypothetical protein